MSEPRRRPFVLFNPAAGRGRSSVKRINMFLGLLERHLPNFEHVVTEYPGQEAHLVDEAIENGFDFIIAVGGDGTWSNVADRIICSSRPDLVFGILASGTGNDFGRNFGVDVEKPEDGVLALAKGKVRAVDVGRVVSYGSPDGTTPVAGRHFLNLIGFGFDVACIETAARALFLRGEVLYKSAALRNLLWFPGIDIDLCGSDISVHGKHLMLTISNGPFFGGSFPIAPDAKLDDGLLDACVIGNAGPFRRMQLFGLAAKGRHGGSSSVKQQTASTFRAKFSLPPKYEIDGEVWQASEAEVVVEVVPRALNIMVSDSA
jgi:diacylglycerol kinase (ATP)